MNERRGVVLPLILIAVGAVWLLQSVGLLAAGSWWQLTRLWPVLLIAIGLQIVFGASRNGRFIVLAVTLGLVIGGLFMLNGRGGGSAEGQGQGQGQVQARGGEPEGSDEAIDIPVDGATSAEVGLGPGIARLTVGAGTVGAGTVGAGTVGADTVGTGTAGAASLVSGNIAHLRRGEPPTTSIERDASHVKVRIDEREHRGLMFWPFGPSQEFGWDIGLSPDVPIDLDVDAGIGEVSLDLREITLESLKLDVGIASTTVNLPGKGSYAVDIDGGIGSIVVLIPAGFEAQIDGDIGIGDLSVPDGFSVFGDERWKSDGFDDASERADITIDGGIGSIAVRVQE